MVSNIFYFYPYLGRSSNLTSIFFRWVGSTTKEKTLEVKTRSSKVSWRVSRPRPRESFVERGVMIATPPVAVFYRTLTRVYPWHTGSSRTCWPVCAEKNRLWLKRRKDGDCQLLMLWPSPAGFARPRSSLVQHKSITNLKDKIDTKVASSFLVNSQSTAGLEDVFMFAFVPEQVVDDSLRCFRWIETSTFLGPLWSSNPSLKSLRAISNESFTLPKTDTAHHTKRKVVFQLSFFRGYARLWGCAFLDFWCQTFHQRTVASWLADCISSQWSVGRIYHKGI